MSFLAFLHGKLARWILTGVVAAPSWFLAIRLIYAHVKGGRDAAGYDNTGDVAIIMLFILYAGVMLLLSSFFKTMRRISWLQYSIINSPLFFLMLLIFVRENVHL